jgi:hypothetical protein
MIFWDFWDLIGRLSILGIHSEGAVIRTLVGLLFLDLIYTLPTPDLLIDIFQTEPLDFQTDAFYKSRQSQIDERISQMNSEEVRNSKSFSVEITIKTLFRIFKKLRRKIGICII